MTKRKHDIKTREDWLMAVVGFFRHDFEAAGHTLPSDIRVTMGFPSTGRASKRIGECWRAEAAQDGAINIYIKPTFGAEDSKVIAGVLVHELCHAACEEGGHGVAFKRIALAVGLEGPMRSTYASAQLNTAIDDCLATIGPIPHGALDPGKGRKKQGTRLCKVSCAECGYTARVTRKWLDNGAPLCPCNELPMTADL